MLGCAGDVPTLEAIAAAALLREHLPELKVRVVNVVDLMRLQPDTEHPHGLSDLEFDALFTTERPVIFAYHGYPWLIHRLTYRRANHDNFHVRGYKEEGTTTTPFDMVMLNDLDRFHLVMDVIDRVPGLGERCAPLRQEMVRRAPAPPRLHARARRGPARRDATGTGRRRARAARRIDITRLAARPGRQRRLQQPEADPARRRGSRRSRPRELAAPRAQVDPERASRGAVDRRLGEADAVGHRIVHGGERFRDAGADRPRGRVRAARAERARAAASAQVAGRARRGHARRCPSCPRSRASTPPFTPRCPPAASTYALPAEWRERWRPAPLRLPRALARLGRAARARAARPRGRRDCGSSAATSARARRCARSTTARSVDTTMGFTPLEGLVMATRSGSVDPGLLLWLLEHERTSPRELADGARARVGPARAWPAARTCARCCSGPTRASDARAARARRSICTGCAAGIAAMAASHRRHRRARVHRRGRRARAEQLRPSRRAGLVFSVSRSMKSAIVRCKTTARSQAIAQRSRRS